MSLRYAYSISFGCISKNATAGSHGYFSVVDTLNSIPANSIGAHFVPCSHQQFLFLANSQAYGDEMVAHCAFWFSFQDLAILSFFFPPHIGCPFLYGGSHLLSQTEEL